ncbi:TonB-dependent receptor [Sphingomonas sp. RHCKR7]|uniref:TonB-dependent receptor plug domain-containing protein n=1 Tax=Sphingomonas folli TaxID=2862497 RepID=UPI001CA4C5A2|nr:TonB-dependent receptor [Sphingomonas folli]MBW6526260.1 TonB-dependent receptor [Sphingomonas folli]
MPSHLSPRAVLLAGALACVVAAPAWAQSTAPADAAPDTTADTTGAGASEDVVVTGSRIARPDYEAPNPIVSFDSDRIQQSGNTNVTTFLQRVPALTTSLDNADSAGPNRPDNQLYGAAGLNLLSLRGLGSARTLVLVNGRRHVSGQIDTAAVDINALPTDLIERVDVLTGGASAVYGADGVSGVVNFILKRDFDGVAGRTQFGISEQGDAGNRFASLMAGKNFAGGRGNVTAYYEYNADDPLQNDDRSFLRRQNRLYTVSNPAYAGPGSGTYQQVLAGDLRYPGGSPAGVIDIGGTLYNGDGSLYDPGTDVGGGFVSGGSATSVAGYVGDLLPKTERHAVNLLTHYDFSDAFQLSLEGKFVQSTATTFGGFTGNYTGDFTLDNPFLPTNLRDAALANAQRVISSNRNNTDFPRLGESDRRRTWRGVIAATGAVSDHARYDVSYTYGQTDVRITKLNDRWEDRYYAALDVVTDPSTGRPTCRSNLNPAAVQVPTVSFTPGPNSGCLPINTFGVNVTDPAALAWATNNNVSSARVTQSVASAALTGDFGALFALPGGPVKFALGGEYRRETSRFDPNSFLTGEQWYQYDEGNKFDPTFVISPSRGAFDVWEVFGEVDVPLLRDRPFFETLSVGAAGRYSDYSTIGSTKAYQFNGIWAPVRDISFRGSYSQAVRAPNIGELFAPVGPTNNFFSDPCYVENRNAGTSTRAANCVALVSGLGADPATFTAANNPDAASLINGARSGNPGLKEETARTWTAGTVLRPRFLPGLTISADWYDIRLDDAISIADANTIANLCVDQPTLDNVYCAAIRRRQGTGYINGYTVQPQNVARFATAGLDLNISYVLRTASAGTFDIRFVGGYLNKLEQIATPGAQVEDQVDQFNRPKYNLVFSPTWTLGEVTLSYNLRWADGTRRFAKLTTDNNPDYAPESLLRYKELWQHDVQVQVAADEGVGFYAGVNNLANQRPSVDSVDQPIASLGRYFYAGAKVRFGA